MRTICLLAVRVERERVAVQLEAALFGDRTLPLLDLGVVEFLDPAALQADQVIVVTALAQFEYRLACLVGTTCDSTHLWRRKNLLRRM